MNPLEPEERLLQEAAQVLCSGGVVAFPTDTSYGLGVNPYNNEAVERVYQLKGRDFDKPLIILIGQERQLEQLCDEISPAVRNLIKTFWPGPLTLLLKPKPELSKYKVFASGKVGVRLPDSLIARSLVNAAQFPITATSANPSGQPSPFSASLVADYFPEKLDLIIDGGVSPAGMDSTVLDVTTSPARLIRAGAIPVSKLRQVVPVDIIRVDN